MSPQKTVNREDNEALTGVIYKNVLLVRFYGCNVRFDRLSNFFIITFAFFKCVGRNYYDGTNTNHRKKSRFFKVFKLPGKKSITTVSKENFEKKSDDDDGGFQQQIPQRFIDR